MATLWLLEIFWTSLETKISAIWDEQKITDSPNITVFWYISKFSIMHLEFGDIFATLERLIFIFLLGGYSFNIWYSLAYQICHDSNCGTSTALSLAKCMQLRIWSCTFILSFVRSKCKLVLNLLTFSRSKLTSTSFLNFI